MKKELTKKTKRKILRDLQTVPKLMVNIRMTEEEKNLLDAKANKYAGGSITALIKHAVKRFSPSPNDLVSVE